MPKLWEFLASNLWSVLSGIMSLYFLWVVHEHVGFPPREPLTATSATYLTLFVFFLVAPYVRSFKLGRFIEFEAKIEAVKSDMKEVRTETRELISTVSTVATAISASVNQNIVQIFPSSEWAQAARQEMSEALGDASEGAKQQDDVREYMNLSASEPNYALARLRMDIERELRRILDRPVSTESRSLTARSLFRTLVSEEPKYQQMRSSFDYVLEVCNAAIHGQRMSDGVASEAVGMGLRILHELKREKLH